MRLHSSIDSMVRRLGRLIAPVEEPAVVEVAEEAVEVVEAAAVVVAAAVAAVGAAADGH